MEQAKKILVELSSDQQAPYLSHPRRRELLGQLKVLGRDQKTAPPIWTESAIKTLSSIAYKSLDEETSREALRVIANAGLLAANTRQMIADNGGGPGAAAKLKTGNVDDEFLAGRILFVMTYDSKLDYDDLVQNHGLADSINAAIQRHSKHFSKKSKRPKAPMSDMEMMAFIEVLKLIFNITHFYPHLAASFSKSIPNIFKVLTRIGQHLPNGVLNPPMRPPVNYMINALLNLDLADEKGQQLRLLGTNAVFPAFDHRHNANHLITILDNALVAYKSHEMEALLNPLLTLIRRVYEIAPPDVKKWMSWLLLPAEEERNMPIGEAETLASRLLRLSTTHTSTAIRGNISSMFFELSDKNASQFVRNVGYGFAAGFLMSHNIQMPKDAMDANAAGDEGPPINPITGQYLDKEKPAKGPAMTNEEKEREAERLFVLFDRLKATGVVNVENPVREAYQSGRIQELPDDATDDEDSEDEKNGKNGK